MREARKIAGGIAKGALNVGVRAGAGASFFAPIFLLAKELKSHVHKVYVNKAQSKRLSDRIQTVLPLLKKAKQLSSSSDPQFIQALQDLKQQLQACVDYVGKFSSKKWYSQVLIAGTANDKFRRLYVRLDESICQLNLGLNVQAVTLQEAAREVQLTEAQAQRKDMQTLCRQNTKILNAIERQQLKRFKAQKTQFTEKQRMRVGIFLAQQRMSAKAQLEELTEPESVSEDPIPEYSKIRLHDIVMGEIIGESRLGMVCRARWQHQEVAVKIIESDGEVLKEEDKAQLVREAQIMFAAQSDYIIRLFGISLKPQQICLVMEYMSHGSLYDLLAESPLPLAVQKELALHVAYGLDSLHCGRMLHRGLNSKDVLINERGIAKIGGLEFSKASSNRVETAQICSGALEWLAPEMFKPGFKYSKASDIYSLGVILWEIFTALHPYADAKFRDKNGGLVVAELIKHIEKEEQFPIPESIPSPLAELVRECLDHRPEMRPDLSDIINKLENYTLELIPSSEELYEQAPSPEELYEQARSKGKSPEAFGLYFAAATLGYAHAMSKVGYFFLKGVAGVTKDEKEARKWFQRAAKRGDSHGQYLLARAYEKGIGDSQELALALVEYEKAGSDPNWAEDAKKAARRLRTAHPKLCGSIEDGTSSQRTAIKTTRRFAFLGTIAAVRSHTMARGVDANTESSDESSDMGVEETSDGYVV